MDGGVWCVMCNYWMLLINKTGNDLSGCRSQHVRNPVIYEYWYFM
jgi:hypothetical protein